MLTNITGVSQFITSPYPYAIIMFGLAFGYEKKQLVLAPLSQSPPY